VNTWKGVDLDPDELLTLSPKVYRQLHTPAASPLTNGEKFWWISSYIML